jgi:hypothetical protein
MCEAVIVSALRVVNQGDGRIRHWGAVEIDGQVRYLRVVTLEDGTTIHNAFIDRNFRPELK